MTQKPMHVVKSAFCNRLMAHKKLWFGVLRLSMRAFEGNLLVSWPEWGFFASCFLKRDNFHPKSHSHSLKPIQFHNFNAKNQKKILLSGTTLKQKVLFLPHFDKLVYKAFAKNTEWKKNKFNTRNQHLKTIKKFKLLQQNRKNFKFKIRTSISSQKTFKRRLLWKI